MGSIEELLKRKREEEEVKIFEKCKKTLRSPRGEREEEGNAAMRAKGMECPNAASRGNDASHRVAMCAIRYTRDKEMHRPPHG